jgi:hypothetical protein
MSGQRAAGTRTILDDPNFMHVEWLQPSCCQGPEETSGAAEQNTDRGPSVRGFQSVMSWSWLAQTLFLFGRIGGAQSAAARPTPHEDARVPQAATQEIQPFPDSRSLEKIHRPQQADP